MDEFRALRNLMLLYDEGAVEDFDASPAPPNDTTLYLNPVIFPNRSTRQFQLLSRRFPNLMTCPAVWAFLHAAIRDLKQQHWHNIPSNLTPNQTKALKPYKNAPIW